MQKKCKNILLQKWALIVFISLVATCTFTLSAQSKTRGNTFVHGAREMSVFKEHHFINGGNGVLPGIVGTKRNGPTYFSFAGTSSVAAVSDAAHVDGYVKNYVHQVFTFPIGDNGVYGPVTTIAPSPITVASPISAAYFRTNPDVAVTTSLLGSNEPALPVGAPFPRTMREVGVSAVSPIEYWDVDGTAPVRLRLHWSNASQINTLTNGMLMGLRIVGWNGTQWVDIPGTLDVGADLNAGTITTNAAIVPNTYTAYTFGVSCDLIDVVFSGVPAGLYLCEGQTGTLDVNVMLGGAAYIPDFILERYEGASWLPWSGPNTDGIFTFTGLPPNVPNVRYRIRINFGTCTRLSDEFILHSYKSATLACQGNLNASVNQDCEIFLHAGIFLTQAVNPPEFYDLVVTDSKGKVVPNPVKNPNNGEIFMVSIKERCTGNSCWSTIKLEDKLAPEITDCHSSQSFACHEFETIRSETAALHFGGSPSFALSRKPDVADNCSNMDVSFVDIISAGTCGVKQIKRAWLFTDKPGNKASCEQILNFTPLSLTDIRDPVAQVVLDCKSDFTPQHIQQAFDNKATLDDSKSRYVIENNEGSVYGGFTYKARGTDRGFHNQRIENNVCNIYTSYTDEEIRIESFSGCIKERKILRKWIVLDDCTNAFRNLTQIIILRDTTGPQFTIAPITQTLGTHDCSASVVVPLPTLLQDDCTEISKLKWSVITPIGTTVSGTMPSYIIHGLVKGIHNITYIVEDCAGNQAQKTTTIHIQDLMAPTVILKQNIVVSLSGSSQGGGYAKLFHTSINNGSYDPCSRVRVEIRRKMGSSCENDGINHHNNNLTYSNIAATGTVNSWVHTDNNPADTDGGEYVTFCCSDIMPGMTYGLHDVEVRVWDDANGNGIIGDTLIINGMRDNFNNGWAKVRVEHKIPPVMTCPKDIVLQCDDTFGLNTQNPIRVGSTMSTGIPAVRALCTDTFAMTYLDRWTSNGICNIGTLERTFRIMDSPISCVQKITVHAHPTPFAVTFAEAGIYQWDQCNFTIDHAKNATHSPKVSHSPCDEIGQHIKIDTFYFSGSACKKWVVQYSYHNHCTGQTIDAPVISYFYNDTITPQWSDLSHEVNAIGSTCTSGVVLKAKLSDKTTCGDQQRLSIDFYLDINGDKTVDYIVASGLKGIVPSGLWTKMNLGQSVYHQVKSLMGNIILADEIHVSYLPSVTGSDAVIQTLPVTIRQGDHLHKLSWKVKDECGNISEQTYEFNLRDQKPPSPICIELSTSITSNSNPSVALWAKDFIIKAQDNCTPDAELYYTFDSVGPVSNMIHLEHYFKPVGGVATVSNLTEYEAGLSYIWVPSTKTAGKVWNTHGIFEVPVYVWDAAGNRDFCKTKVTVINTDMRTTISGKVESISGVAKKGAMVHLVSSLEDQSNSTLSDDRGEYLFEVPLNAEYTVSAEYVGDYLEGVSTLDLVLIQRHILDLQRHDNVYKMIASDANNDGKITASDLVELRKLILGVTNTFNNKSWRLPKKLQNLDLTYPFPYKEGYSENPLMLPMQKVDFVAVKIGDINGNASGAQQNIVEPRSNKKLNFEVANVVLEPQERIYVPVYASNFKDIFGFQTTLKLKDAVFVDLIPEGLDIDATSIGKLNDDTYTLSYAAKQPLTIDRDKKLFTLVIDPKNSVLLEDILQLSSEITRSESYTSDLKVSGLSITFRNDVNNMALLQNEPNPYIFTTNIRWLGTKSENVKLVITDDQGKIMLVRNVKSVKGLNTITLEAKDIPYAGIYFYTLSGNTINATKKMVKIE
jgi:hypothetical protein